MHKPISFTALLPDGWRDLSFVAFRDGVEIAQLRTTDPAVALLRYQPGACVPHHEHTGLETILVLEGTQSDERGDYPSGTLVLNPKGSAHSVWSANGCTVLIQWESPVRFTEER
ncbi:MAG: cupin domain-containing protein [Roseinatronobacter sp.]|nr:cupin domain-containing protein [Roseinatronobacter sp.]